jgi:hypothetical protein
MFFFRVNAFFIVLDLFTESENEPKLRVCVIFRAG